VKLICEPREPKLRPQTANDVQGSLYYSVAAALTNGKFDLQDLELSALNDPAVLDLAAKVTWTVDPESGFPESFSGELQVIMQSGERFVHREQVNREATRGADCGGT
jgi:2-methylcitrate dehydratase PrpD